MSSGSDIGQTADRKYAVPGGSAACCFTAPSKLVTFTLLSVLQSVARCLLTYLLAMSLQQHVVEVLFYM